MRNRDPHHDEPVSEIEPGLAGGSGGQFMMPTDSPIHHRRRPDAGVSDLNDYDATEGDDDLLNPGSPEFERLTKPIRRDEEP